MEKSTHALVQQGRFRTEPWEGSWGRLIRYLVYRLVLAVPALAAVWLVTVGR